MYFQLGEIGGYSEVYLILVKIVSWLAVESTQPRPHLHQDFNLYVALIISCLFKVMIVKSITPYLMWEQVVTCKKENQITRSRFIIILVYIIRNSDYRIIRTPPPPAIYIFIYARHKYSQFQQL